MIKHNPVLIRNEQDEYTQVRRDLTLVITLNLILLAVLLGLYFVNRHNNAVDQFFFRLLNF
jgi:hypothetical protein